MTVPVKDAPQRTYGQWRLGKSAGLFGLGTTGTVTLGSFWRSGLHSSPPRAASSLPMNPFLAHRPSQSP